MISHHRTGDIGNGLDRMIEYILTHKFHKYLKLNLWSFNSLILYRMKREVAVVNPSSPPAGLLPSDKKRGRSKREQRSRSRVRAPLHASSNASQQPQPVASPPGAQQIQSLATQRTNVDSASVEPQSRVSDLSRSPQRKDRVHRNRFHKTRRTENSSRHETAE